MSLEKLQEPLPGMQGSSQLRFRLTVPGHFAPSPAFHFMYFTPSEYTSSHLGPGAALRFFYLMKVLPEGPAQKLFSPQSSPTQPAGRHPCLEYPVLLLSGPFILQLHNFRVLLLKAFTC